MADATAPESPHAPAPHVLDAALKRRAELRETIRDLGRALEAASPGREADWLARVGTRLAELHDGILEHIERTEAPDGLYDEIRSAQPRLNHQVSRLVADHAVLRDRSEQCCALAARATASPDAVIVKAVRDDATQLVSLLQRHRQRGSDLIFEAYETDIGGAD